MGPFVLALGAACVASVALGCSSAPASQRSVTSPSPALASKPATLSCPALDAGNVDFAALFGVDSQVSARLARTVRFAAALERSVTELQQQASSACQVVALDLGGTPRAGEHPCQALSRRTQELKQTLGSGGFRASVSGLSCSIPTDAVASCAGECLTGQVGVVSAVNCVKTAQGECGLDILLPNASRECAAECAVSSLSRAVCTAQVDVKIGTGEVTPPEYVAMAEALRRDLPKLFGIASSLAPRGAAIAAEAVQLVDDLAASIDDLSSGRASLDRRAVTGIVLGGCVAPRLAQVVRESEKLKTALAVAAQAQASFSAP